MSNACSTWVLHDLITIFFASFNFRIFHTVIHNSFTFIHKLFYQKKTVTESRGFKCLWIVNRLAFLKKLSTCHFYAFTNVAALFFKILYKDYNNITNFYPLKNHLPFAE